MLEKSTGTTLTDEQKAAVKAANDALDKAMKAADSAFLSQVASAVGLTVDQLQARLQAVSPGRPKGLTANIETLLPDILGRALTDSEKTAVIKAIGAWNEAVKSATETYRAALEKALGTSAGESGGTGKDGKGKGDKDKGGKGGGCGGGSTGGMFKPGTTTGTTDTTDTTDTTTYQATAYSRHR